VFAKETTGRRYPEVLAEPEFLATGAVHTFLIRHPRETIASYHAMNPEAGLAKMGFESLYEIFTSVSRLSGRPPVVMDAADLMRRPAEVVAAYCARVGIPFLPDALAWQPADRPEWELSSRWHTDVAASAGLGNVADAGTVTRVPRDGLDVERHPVLGGYLRYHLPYYEILRARRLTG
jgi:hypothetical protein